jgi:hypothetical protein
MGCSRSRKYQRLCRLVAASCSVKQKYIQSSRRKARSSIQVDSLTEIDQSSTPLNNCMYVTPIRNNVSSSKLAARTACSASKSTSSCLDYTAVMRCLNQKLAIGASVAHGPEYVEDARERGQPPISALSFEFKGR